MARAKLSSERAKKQQTKMVRESKRRKKGLAGGAKHKIDAPYTINKNKATQMAAIVRERKTQRDSQT
jgi:hypothetical protein